MICEPNLNLPQLIDLDSMKKSNEIANDVERKLLNRANMKSRLYEQKEYNMLSLYNNQFDHLNDILSLHSNVYLACRWNSFLDNVAEKYIHIRLYVDYKKSLEPSLVRRKLLNGKFYDMKNKIAPIPQLSDPRSFAKRI